MNKLKLVAGWVVLILIVICVSGVFWLCGRFLNDVHALRVEMVDRKAGG